MADDECSRPNGDPALSGSSAEGLAMAAVRGPKPELEADFAARQLTREQ